MNRSGFTLIEVLFATFLSAILISLLFTSFFQSNRIVRLVESVINFDFRSSILSHQLERDLSGSFIPLEYQDQKQREAQEEKQKNEEPKKQQEKEVIKEKDSQKKKSGRKLEKIFFAKQKNKMLEMLTFITNNPLQAYPYGSLGSVNPRIVRVVYRLKEESTNPSSYSLVRQESHDLDLNKFTPTKVPEFILASNIKSLKTKFTALVLKQVAQEDTDEKNKEAQKQEPKTERILKTYDDWNYALIKKENTTEEDEQEVVEIPILVQIEGSFWESDLKRKEKEFKLSIPILPDFSPQKEVKKADVNATDNKAIKPNENLEALRQLKDGQTIKVTKVEQQGPVFYFNLGSQG